MVVPIDIPTTSREENRGRRLRTDQRVSKSRDRWLRPIFGRREASITWAGSRDPLRYINGANTYQFVGSDPAEMSDAFLAGYSLQHQFHYEPFTHTLDWNDSFGGKFNLWPSTPSDWGDGSWVMP